MDIILIPHTQADTAAVEAKLFLRTEGGGLRGDSSEMTFLPGRTGPRGSQDSGSSLPPESLSRVPANGAGGARTAGHPLGFCLSATALPVGRPLLPPSVRRGRELTDPTEICPAFAPFRPLSL